MAKQKGVKAQRAGLFPAARAIESVPDDTQVVLWGEAHEDMFHRQLLYLNFPDFAAASFRFAFENMECANAGTKTMVDRMGYRPYHLQRYEYVTFPNRRDVRSAVTHTPYDDQYNHFRNIHNGASEFKLLKAASRLGMEPVHIDMSMTDMAYSLTSEGMTARNNHMADKIADMVDNGKKILLCCGWAHLFSTRTPKFRGCKNSLQELLAQKNIKTFTFANVPEPEDLLVEGTVSDDDGDPALGDYINHNDRFAASLIDEIYEQGDLEFASRVFSLNVKDFSLKAGREIPDQLIVYPTATINTLMAHKSRSMYVINPVFEDEIWNDLWHTHGIPAHRAYKAARRQP